MADRYFMFNPRLFMLIAVLSMGQLCLADQTAPATAVPIVDAQSGQLYGAVAGTHWLAAEKATALMEKDLIFRAYASDGTLLGETKLSKVETSEICSNPTYQANKAKLRDQVATLIGPSWKATPSKPQIFDPKNPTYQKLVAAWLQKQGIDDPQPELTQLWRIDLDGDHREEVLIAASRHRGSATSTSAGDYSILLLRKLVNSNDVVTLPIQSEIYPEECIAECALATHEIIGLLDFNNDGSLEIISRSTAYESYSQSIYVIENNRVEKQLEWFCGA